MEALPGDISAGKDLPQLAAGAGEEDPPPLPAASADGDALAGKPAGSVPGGQV